MHTNMSFIPLIFKYTAPSEIPLCFNLGRRVIKGIPEEFAPKATFRAIDSNIVEYIIEGQSKGLKIVAEYREYRDFPVTEWRVTLTNVGKKDTPIISDLRIGGELAIGDTVLTHGNGDTCKRDGYTFFDDAVKVNIRLTPFSGTSCQGAFPYMTLRGEGVEVRAAIGFPAKWVAEVEPTEKGVFFLCGQDRCHTRLSAGESYTSPRLTLMAYGAGSIYRGINIWRRFYFAHILPKDNGAPLAPKYCLHNFRAGGKPEFTGATEENQIEALKAYLEKRMQPDIWWFDAGWHPCTTWWQTGTWKVDEARFPRGLAPLGKACAEKDVDLLLWFEPERVRPGEEIDRDHPEFLLAKAEGGDKLLDLGDPQARAWITDRVDSIIKEAGVKYYRQDFNFDPLPIWVENEAPDRIGFLENRHAMGYLAYWDELVRRNPGLIIDSCASGGRRNDLETMRRAVTLHYTDVGYGDHPIKQKQHRVMFEWIPYFRAHNMNWFDEESGKYDGKEHQPDSFSFHNAMAPCMTDMIHHTTELAESFISIIYKKIWQEVAEIELCGDYYPISNCDGTPNGWYAMQFDDPERRRGFVQIIRNADAEDDEFVLKMPCIRKTIYTFKGAEFSKYDGAYNYSQLRRGINVKLQKYQAMIIFYGYDLKYEVDEKIYSTTLAAPNGDIQTDITIVSEKQKENITISVTAELCYDGKKYIGRGKDPLWIDAIADLQKQLPDGVVLKCCISCKHGNIYPCVNPPGDAFCLKQMVPKDKDDVWNTLDEGCYRDIYHCQNYFDCCEDYDRQNDS